MRKKDFHNIHNSVIDAVQGSTGKVPHVNIVILPNGKKTKIPEFILLFQNVELLLVQFLHQSTCKVLMYFRAVCKYNNEIEKDISEISKYCDLSEITVKRAIKQLCSYNIIALNKSKSDKRRNTYLINPQSSWKGVVEKIKQIYTLFHSSNDYTPRHFEHELKNLIDSKNLKILNEKNEL